MERNVFCYDDFKANYVSEMVGEFEFFTINGTYKIRIYEDDFLMLILPMGKYFMVSFSFVMDDNPNHYLLQYEGGMILKWIRGIIATNFLDREYSKTGSKQQP